jgi:octaprenyl-diphosphate synthase
VIRETASGLRTGGARVGWGLMLRMQRLKAEAVGLAVLPHRNGVVPVTDAHLAGVEREIGELLAEYGEHPLCQSAITLMESGGKRRRAEMVLAFAGAAGEPGADAVGAAAVVELLHAATLIHDDVIDKAGSRRGRTSTNARFGNSAAVLGGDLLLALAGVRAAQLDSERMMRGEEMIGFSLQLAHALRRLVEGEALELEAAFDTRRSVNHYLATIDGKTAALFALAAQIGFDLAGAEATDEAVAFALAYGKAFQITDDILDVVADPVVLGKPTMNDVREGVFTLPIIITLMKDPRARRLLRGRLIDADALRAALHRANAIDESVQFADGLLRDAEACAARLGSAKVGAWCVEATGQLRAQLHAWR